MREIRAPMKSDGPPLIAPPPADGGAPLGACWALELRTAGDCIKEVEGEREGGWGGGTMTEVGRKDGWWWEGRSSQSLKLVWRSKESLSLSPTDQKYHRTIKSITILWIFQSPSTFWTWRWERGIRSVLERRPSLVVLGDVLREHFDGQGPDTSDSYEMSSDFTLLFKSQNQEEELESDAEKQRLWFPIPCPIPLFLPLSY